MTTFLDRLESYYINTAKTFETEASRAAVFPNGPDKGTIREEIYVKFLKEHLPSKCQVLQGGFLFHSDGRESKQLDIIVTTDTAHTICLNGKSFAPVEGTLGIVSVKSTLDKAKLFESLDELASIPPTSILDGKKSELFTVKDYDDWPLKIIYASNGISTESIRNHLSQYYLEHSNVPFSRRPNIVHVSNKCFILRAIPGKIVGDSKGNFQPTKTGEFLTFTVKPDLHAVIEVIDQLQLKASISNHILFTYSELFNSVKKRATLDL